MTVKIPVQADFDPSSVERQLQAFEQKLNALGQKIAQANKAQFSPISKTSLQDMQKMLQQFEALRRVSGDLNKRINATGQKGVGFADLDWGALYPDPASRNRQMAKAFQYVTGHAFAPGAGGGGGGRYDGSSRNPWVQTGANAVQAGLRGLNGVTGGAGGVAAGALNTGMSAGFGAGMMGLLGGMLALGVGKLVSAATEKIQQAEDNSVAYDKLKRTIGDVNVSFRGLKAAIEGAAQNVNITFDESARLATQFAKQGNLRGDQYASLEGELRTGVGMSRALGLDPSQGMGFLGTMRGMRQTQDEQGSRKMALLIGETIAKSNAFAKADEVMEAISNYVTTQTRYSLGANAGGYAGMFSSMVGSGIPGMDPMGAAGMLSRINSSLMAGGAKGEASQFFTAMVGKRMGLDPLQTQLLREAGAFATNDQVFGKGSIYERATGRTGPGGRDTLLGSTMGMLGQAYGGNSEQAIMLRAQATANHLGISMTQALALGTLQPNQMGDLEASLQKQGLKIGDINMGGLASLSKVVSGTGADRLGVAKELWSRSGKDALSAKERENLDRVMKSGSAQEQKDLLTALVASRDQEQTQGKDIRDSKTALENIKTLMADQLLPVTQSMRDGVMYLAGGGKMSPQKIREELAKAEIGDKYDRQIAQQKERFQRANEGLDSRGLVGGAYAKAKEAERSTMVDANDKINKLKAQRDAEIEGAIKKLNEAPPGAAPATAGPSAPDGWRAPESSSVGASSGGEALYNSLLKQESGGRHTDANGNLITSKKGARGISQVMPATGKDPGLGVKPLQNESEEEYRRFGIDYLNALIKRYGGDRAKALAAYNAGIGRVDAAIAKKGANWLSAMPKETQHYVPSILGHAGTPMPEDAPAGRADKVSMGPLSGQVSLALDLTPDARRLLQGPSSMPSARLSQVGQPFVA